MKILNHFFILFILPVYLLANIGLQLNIGFCGKKIQDISLGVEKHTCLSCKKSSSNSCCKDSIVYQKLDAKHTISIPAKIEFTQYPILISQQYSQFILPIPFSGITSIQLSRAPPNLLSQPPIYLKNRIILI